MSVKLEFTNLDQFVKSFSSTSDNANKEIDKILKKTVNELIRDIKRLTPSRTGRLRAAWHRTGSKKKYSIENDMEYASYVENGSRYIVPRRMLQKAFNLAEKRLKKRLAALGRKLQREF